MKNLVLLHGALGHAGQFDGIIPLLENNFAVSTFNFSGHAWAKLQGGLSIAKLCEDAVNFLNDKEIEKANFFGHSMGGYVALYMARHHAERVESVMTMGTKLKWTPDIAGNEARMLNPGKMKEKVPAFAAQLEKIHGPQWEQLCKLVADMLVEMGNELPLDVEDFEHIETPVQLSVGDRDRMVSIEETLDVFRMLKNGRFLVMPGTAHPYEQIDGKRLVYKINGFLGIE